MTKAKLPPGPGGNVLFSPALKELKTNVLGLVERQKQDFKDISRIMIGPYQYINIYKPEFMEQIFADSVLFSKGRENANLKFLLGNGLLTNEGDFWLKQRRLIAPVFHKKRLATFVQQIIACTDRMMDSWEERGDVKMDIHAEMTQITLGIVSQTLMSTDASGDFLKINDALVHLMKGLSTETVRLIRLPSWVPTSYNRFMKKNRAILDKQIYDIIAERRRTGSQRDDLLTMLMEVEDADTAERMTDGQLRDEVMTIFLAGNETSSNALTWTLYLLSQNPEAEQKMIDEIDAKFNAGVELNFKTVTEFQYVKQVIEESMRVHPPVWMVGRRTIEEDEIGGYRIEKQTNVLIPIIYLHHTERFWDEPDKFKPERFAPETRNNIDRFVYFPFGGGPRVCIGNNFAMLEMQVILITLYRQFKFKVKEGFVVEPEPLVTLRPRYGMMMYAEKR